MAQKSAGALGATAKELQFMVEVNESGFFPDFILKLMNRARSLNRFNAAAIGANEVVAMNARKQKSEIGGPLVKPQATNHPFFSQSLQKSEDGGLVTLFREMSALGEFIQGHGTVTLPEAGENRFKAFGSTQTRFLCPGDELFQRRYGDLFRFGVGRHC